jgi:hypothetical protein
MDFVIINGILAPELGGAPTGLDFSVLHDDVVDDGDGDAAFGRMDGSRKVTGRIFFSYRYRVIP